MRRFATVIAAFATVAPIPALATPPIASWELLGPPGETNFVLITGKRKLDGEIFHMAVDALCQAKQVCQILFWGDRAMAPVKAPMSDEQSAAMIASWVGNDATDTHHFLWNCTAYPQAKADECM